MKVRTMGGEQDARYRGVTIRIGTALLFFWVLFDVLQTVLPIFYEKALSRLPLRDYTVAQSLCEGGAYFLSFLLPALLLIGITRGRSYPTLLSPRLPDGVGLWIVGGMAVIVCCSIVNSSILELLGYSSWTSNTAPSPLPMHAYEGVLWFITTAIVPALCEELLFRGVILSRLLPFGKTTAVLGSAVLFGLMHQNVEQIVYTTAAGIVLAVVCLQGGSIWGSVLVHFFNNLFSVTEQILWERLPEDAARLVCGSLEVLLIGVGFACLLLLIVRHDRGQLQSEPWPDGVPMMTARPKRPMRDFLTPTVVLFAVLCLLQATARIWLSVLLLSWR